MNANNQEMLRLFYALWPDDLTRGELRRLQQSIHGRKTSYANLHITLAFLGQQPATLLPALKDILMHLPRTALSLTLDRIGYFSRNRIAWAGMHAVPDALPGLQQSLAQALTQNGIAFDSQLRFKPHITLARDAAPPLDIVFDPIAWQANHVALVQSVMKPEGSTYQVLEARRIDTDVWIPGDAGN
ncbi:MAG TPA: RNA 2',3'-cyclic phosphodiesterase [Noviherbaspirillum sp.]|nr:RNA 2',3'-cyclic phosphodiesterase [Noviherbaspirillum sp.]